MKNQQPLVSVLLLAMNHEKFIAQAVHSILNQTYKNFEVVFLDNNSKDKTLIKSLITDKLYELEFLKLKKVIFLIIFLILF